MADSNDNDPLQTLTNAMLKAFYDNALGQGVGYTQKAKDKFHLTVSPVTDENSSARFQLKISLAAAADKEAKAMSSDVVSEAKRGPRAYLMGETVLSLVGALKQLPKRSTFKYAGDENGQLSADGQTVDYCFTANNIPDLVNSFHAILRLENKGKLLGKGI